VASGDPAHDHAVRFACRTDDHVRPLGLDQTARLGYQEREIAELGAPLD
jgi:hypothetical protein